MMPKHPELLRFFGLEQAFLRHRLTLLSDQLEVEHQNDKTIEKSGVMEFPTISVPVPFVAAQR